MNKEQQDKLWNELNEEKKEKYRKDYKEAMEDCGESALIVRRELLAEIFGTHNLNPKQIKTWEDVEKEGKYCGYLISKTGFRDHESGECPSIVYNSDFFSHKIIDKVIATMKIEYLIENSYGGMITESEWEDVDVRKFRIVRLRGNLTYAEGRGAYEFVAFHTPEQREEFMSYESNRRLVEQYFMI